jgi:hypothetical protein
MITPVGQCEANIRRARELLGLARVVGASTTPVLDVSEILRSALVGVVSALDHYVHAIVRELMVDVQNGSRGRSTHFDDFKVPLSVVQQALVGMSCDVWLGEEVRRQHTFMSFQHPDRISEVLRFVDSEPIWPRVADNLGLDPGFVKQRLKLIVDRRNKIAHEADLDPTPPHDPWPISDNEVENAISFIEDVVRAIDDILRRR